MWRGKIKDFASRRFDGFAHRKSLNRLKGSLRDADQVMRMKAIDGLYALACAWRKQDAISYRQACAAFILSLRDPDQDVRLRSVERLKSLAADPEFPEPGLLLLALRDPGAPVRELAARACLDSHNLPLMMEALKSPDAEVRRIVASGIGDDIYSRLQRVDMYDRWSRGQPSVQGKTAPSDSVEDRALFIRDKAMEQEMLRYIAKAVVTFLIRSGSIGLAEEVYVKALRLYGGSSRKRTALNHLLFDLMNEDPAAKDAALRILQGGDPAALLQPYIADGEPTAHSVAPRCDLCNKELEALDLTGVPESILSPSVALYDAVVCTSCRKVECSACKSSRREDSCRWCGRRAVLAHSHLL